jgi:hypothetical protein
MSGYRDRWIECGTDALRVRGYYFPWGTKRIGYDAIRSIRRMPIGPLTGKPRIWGTANPRYWAGLDPSRPRKSVAFTLDIGQRIQPLLTPEDPEAFEHALRAHADLPPTETSQRGPIV